MNRDVSRSNKQWWAVVHSYVNQRRVSHFAWRSIGVVHGSIFSDPTRSGPSRYGPDPIHPDCPATLRHTPKMWPQRQRFALFRKHFSNALAAAIANALEVVTWWSARQMSWKTNEVLSIQQRFRAWTRRVLPTAAGLNIRPQIAIEAQINRVEWVTLGQNLGRKGLTDVSQILTRHICKRNRVVWYTNVTDRQTDEQRHHGTVTSIIIGEIACRRYLKYVTVLLVGLLNHLRYVRICKTNKWKSVKY